MLARAWIAGCFGCGLIVSSAFDAVGNAPMGSAAKPHVASAKSPARAKNHARAKSPARARPSASAPQGHQPPRTLQDVHIEGEIPVPQVLFITARDQRRFLDLQHRRYLRTSQQIGEQTVFPSWIGVTGHPPTDVRKETPR